MSNTKPYDHLRAWCYMMGSDSGYTRAEIDLAREQDAPDDAVYRDVTGKWVSFATVTNGATVAKIGARVAQYRMARQSAGIPT